MVWDLCLFCVFGPTRETEKVKALSSCIRLKCTLVSALMLLGFFFLFILILPANGEAVAAQLSAVAVRVDAAAANGRLHAAF